MSASEKQPLERLTINLIPRAVSAMLLAMNITGHSKTDTVNRALQFYAFAEEINERGGEILTREPGSDELTVIKFL